MVDFNLKAAKHCSCQESCICQVENFLSNVPISKRRSTFFDGFQGFELHQAVLNPMTKPDFG